jgi:hypothetical protein
LKKIIFILFLLFTALDTMTQGLFINGSGAAAYVSLKGSVHLVINAQATTGITRTTAGGIINTDNNENDYVDWVIKNGTTGDYIIPWMSTEPTYIPFTYHVGTIGSNDGTVLFSTWRTQKDNWTALGGGVSGHPTGVTNMYDNGVDNSLNTIDRFWWVKFSGYSMPPQANLTFYYVDNADFVANNIVSGGNESNLFAQYWNGSLWVRPGIGIDYPNPGSDYVSGGITSQIVNVPWTLDLSTSPLPIELLSFNAICKENIVDLNWTTASETNNDFFTIERSKDAQSWEIVTVIPGAGNSNTILHYNATDNNPYPDYTYYRLKQTDYNGAFTYSHVVMASCGSQTPFDLVSIITTPHGGGIDLSFTAEEGEQYTYALYNVLGKLLQNKSEKAVAGMNEVHISTQNVSEGIYIVTLQNDAKFFGKKIFLSDQY